MAYREQWRIYSVNFDTFLFHILISRSIVSRFPPNQVDLRRQNTCVQSPRQEKLKKTPIGKIYILARNRFFAIFSKFSMEFSLRHHVLWAVLLPIACRNSFGDILKEKFYREIWMQILAGKFKLLYFRFPGSDIHQILRVDAVCVPVHDKRIRARLSQTVQKLFKKNHFRKSRKSDFCVRKGIKFPRRLASPKRDPLGGAPIQSGQSGQI